MNDAVVTEASGNVETSHENHIDQQPQSSADAGAQAPAGDRQRGAENHDDKRGDRHGGFQPQFHPVAGDPDPVANFALDGNREFP